MIARRRHSALALVAVLWLVALLTGMVVLVGKNTQLDGRMTTAQGDLLSRRWACRSGIEQALALLATDDTASDGLTDVWHDNPTDCNDIVLGAGEFTIAIDDEAGKLNINIATTKQLMALDGMTEEIAECIIDWRDEDSNVQPHGAEAGYYLNLDVGYDIRNASFRTVRELLVVRGFTREHLYGEDTNANGKLDPHEDDGDDYPPYDNEDGLLERGWLHLLTCYSYDRNRDAAGNERVNINKVEENDLIEKLDLSKSHAKWIVENRKEEYKSIADLIDKDSHAEPAKKDKNGEDDDKAEKLDMQTYRDIIDKITIHEDDAITGRINVNTADRAVLAALFEGDEKLAHAVITQRDAAALQDIGELLDISAITVEKFKKIAESVTTRSSVFQVRCRARSPRSSASSYAAAIVDRNTSPAQILYWHQGVNH